MGSARQLSAVSRQLQRCVRQLHSFTDGQVCMTDCDWDQLKHVTFEVSPNDGLYKGATFLFKVAFADDYPVCAPTVTCLTPIYHPNIDPYGGDGNVCVSLLNEWTASNSLEDMIQALLFLMYNPAVDDPLSELVPSAEVDLFEKRARAIYVEGKNPFWKDENAHSGELPQNVVDDDDEEIEDVGVDLEKDFFAPAMSKKMTREEWELAGRQKTEEFEKGFCQEVFVEKVNKAETEEKLRLEEEERKREEEKLRVEEEERKRKEEEARLRKEESDNRLQQLVKHLNLETKVAEAANVRATSPTGETNSNEQEMNRNNENNAETNTNEEERKHKEEEARLRKEESDTRLQQLVRHLNLETKVAEAANVRVTSSTGETNSNVQDTNRNNDTGAETNTNELETNRNNDSNAHANEQETNRNNDSNVCANDTSVTLYVGDNESTADTRESASNVDLTSDKNTGACANDPSPSVALISDSAHVANTGEFVQSRNAEGPQGVSPDHPEGQMVVSFLRFVQLVKSCFSTQPEHADVKVSEQC